MEKDKIAIIYDSYSKEIFAIIPFNQTEAAVLPLGFDMAIEESGAEVLSANELTGKVLYKPKRKDNIIYLDDYR